ncbi:Alpha/Beta hydrolase protein [Papiliotrema laurentii]|uniref:Alpha/Beta hydrolase protein n=1 Tax=Papiliotrema laurentii TaxID=5418 RepID=A0AAD9D294_PAPLA|nr:Alpha/Beta hydrolase protein [Papiliotrema laurentii]
MSVQEPAIISASGRAGTASGRLSWASDPDGPKPLVVLIHGGGVNAKYFDNELHSIPTDFNKRGYNVLNVNRIGYGGNPLPLTSTPLFDAIPTYLDLIAEAYSQQGGQGGIVIFGHSLGGVTALAIAAVNEVSAKQDGSQKLPLKGVSALGSVPSALAPSEILSALASVEGDRLPINTNPTDEEKRRFLGTPEFFEETNLDKVLPALEQGVKNEYLEWLSGDAYERFVGEIAPNIKIPLQYLAGEIELHWPDLPSAEPIFQAAVALFGNAPSIDAGLLKGGAHNFEYSKSAHVLADRRFTWLESLLGISR